MAGENNELLPADPGYAYGDVLPLRRRLGANGLAVGPVELALPNMVRGAINDLAATITGPGLAVQGQLSPDQINALAPRMAGTMMGLGLGASPLLEPAAGDFLGSFKGWHGTPHVFEPVEHNPFGEFRDSAIGSGEGAQVYGHGHYVAGARQTAEEYQNKLAKPVPLLDGKKLPSPLPGSLDNKKSPDQDFAIAMLNNTLQDGNYFPSTQHWINGAHDYIRETGAPDSMKDAAHAWLDNNVDRLELKPRSGSLLHLEIKPDEHELLDWDNSIENHLPKLEKMLGEDLKPSDIWNTLRGRWYAGDQDFGKPGWDHIKGEALYEYLTHKLGSEPAASKALAEAGIPGIKYLDQFSRGKTGIANDIRLVDVGQGKYELRAYNKQTGQKFTTDQFHSNLSPEEVKSILGDEVGGQMLSDITPGTGIGSRAWHDGPVNFKGTSNYVIFDPKNIEIKGRE